MKPTCFTDDAQFIHWLATDKVFHNRSGGQRQMQTFVCTDCTPTFATKMRLEGKCEHPDVEFKLVNSGELVGVKPVPKKEPRVLKTKAEMGASGMTGIQWHYLNQRWLVQFQRNGKIHNGGYFHGLEDAKAACVALLDTLK